MKRANRIILFKFTLTFLLIFGMALVCGTATGQNVADESEFLLEEIVVTAEFREKTIQETPLSITGINAEMLEARNQVSLDQIAAQAPNVSLRPANASLGNSLVAYIRGIGQSDFNPSVEAGVGIYVDDVYYSTITGNILQLLDLERVEVLRGPQGTLAGRNALGGAIKLFTRKPDGKDDGYISMTVGDYNRLDVKAAGGFTIFPDKLFMRIAGASNSRDGYITSYDYACVHGLPDPGSPGGLPTFVPVGGHDCELGKEGGQSMTAGRFSMRWVASDNFEVNFSANIVNDKSEAQPTILLYAKDTSGSSLLDPSFSNSVPIFFDNNGNGAYDLGIDVPYGRQFVTAGKYYNYSTYIDDGRDTPDFRFQGGTPGQNINVYKPVVLPRINHLESKDYTLNINWQLSDNVSLLSVTSYREYENSFADDNDGSPLVVQQLLQRMTHEQWTQELRLNAKLWDGFADLTLGGFYLDQETNEDARVDLNYAGFDFTHGPDLVPSKNTGLYGQLALNLSDRMDLALGLRYSKDEKSYTFNRHNPDGSLPEPFNPFLPPVGLFQNPFDASQPANNLVAGLTGTGVSYESSRLDYRVAFDYKFTDDVMGYAQVATGYRAGGNNARPFYPSQVHAFDPEELTNYEVGVKSTLWDQLRLNASVFFNDYKDIQLPLNSCFFAPTVPFDQQTPCASQENVGDGEVKGIEIEGLWYPTRELLIDFSYSYLDFEYTRLDPLTDVDPSSRTPYTPESTWSLGAQYRFDLGKFGDLTHRIDVQWQDEIFAAFINTTRGKIDSYYVANYRATWRSVDLKWQASLEITNLFDEYYYLTIFDLYDDAGFTNAQPGHPREWAFTIKRSWFWD